MGLLKDIYTQVKDRLTEDVEWLCDFRLENSQFELLGEGDAEALLFPAITIHYNDINYTQQAADNDLVDMEVTLRVAFESYKVDDLILLDWLDDVADAMQKPFGVGNFYRISSVQDIEHDNIIVWEMVYGLAAEDCYIPKKETTVEITEFDTNLTLDIDNYDIRTGDGK